MTRIAKALLITLLALQLPAQVRVNVGGPVFVDGGGVTWDADTSCNGSALVATTDTIAGTLDDVLFTTGDKATSSFSCSFIVTSGIYRVRLRWAEVENSPVGSRGFNILGNSQQFFSIQDVRAQAGNATAYERDFLISIPGTTLDVVLTRISGDPFLQAIEVEKVSLLSHGTTLPTNCTLGEQFFDTDAVAGSNIYCCTATDTWTQCSIGGVAGFTEGSVVFISPTGILTEDNSNLFFDDSADELGLGTAVPERQFHIKGAGQAVLDITDAGNKAGTSYIQDSGFAANNGGAIILGAGQGFFSGIKGILESGVNNTTGSLNFLTRTLNTDTNLTAVARLTPAGNLHMPPTATGSARFNIGGNVGAGSAGIQIGQTINQAVSTEGVHILPAFASTNTGNHTGFSFLSTVSTSTGNSSTGGEQNGFGCFHEGTTTTTAAGLFCGDFHIIKDTGVVDGVMTGLEVGMHKVPALGSAKNYGLHLWSGDFGTITGTTQAGVAINIEGDAGWLWPFKYFTSGLNNSNTAIPEVGIDNGGDFHAVRVGGGTSNNVTAPIHGRGASFPVAKFERTGAVTNFVVNTMEVEAESSANIVDGFGAGFTFSFQDDTTTSSSVASIAAVRDGADNSARLSLQSSNSGTLNEKVNVPVDGGFQWTDQGSRPTCDVTHRGTIYYDAGGAGVADTAEMCLKNSSNAYNWRAIATP